MNSNGRRAVSVADLAAPTKHALNGGPFGSKLVGRDYVPDGIPVIRGCNLAGDGRFSVDELVFVTPEKAKSLSANIARRGDLVFTQRGTLGQVGLIPHHLPYEQYVVSQSQMKLTVDSRKANSTFLYYYFRAPETVRRIENLALTSGVPHINLAILREFLLELPCLSCQGKVAAILSAYDDLIDNNTRRIAIVESMARLLYEHWFVRFRFPGHEHARFRDSPLGAIPEGWQWVTLRDIARDERRAVSPEAVEADVPYVGLEHIPRRSIALQEWGRAGDVQSTKLRFEVGNILFGKIRPYFHKVCVAPISGICSSDAIVIHPLDTSFFGLVLSCVSSDAFVAHATQTSQGTKMPRANWDVLLNYPVPMPPADLLATFNEFVRDIVALVQNLVLSNRALRGARDLLLPRLISGEIDVSDLGIQGVELTA
jgi:type I restriction enzyme S subunit